MPWIQSRVVQAQYYKDAKDYETYLEKNIFLPDINNEKDQKNATYIANLKSLTTFVLVMFEDDDMVVPKESAWFGYWNEVGDIVHLKDQPLYKEDWLGLRYLDDHRRLIFLKAPGRHVRTSNPDLRLRVHHLFQMEIELAYLRDEIIPKYLAEKKIQDPKLIVQT